MTKEEKKKYLKKRKDVRCDCKKRRPNEDRSKYGTCRCDSYSMSHTFGIVISNYLYQYLADAKGVIIREDWEIIEKHADAIRDYAEDDNSDINSDELRERWKFLEKERKWREAMFWLTENIQSLWW